ncbi:MAG: PIG-L family deacetylase [Acidobacteriota bacterium]
MPRRLVSYAVATIAVATGLAVATGDATLRAQNRKTFSIVNEDSGHVALGLALRKLNVTATFMQCPAHPDDETNSLLAMAGYGLGLRSIDVQNNRGEGGQNEIGPELFRDIGVLRTSELLAAHQIDGAEQYFTRAIDYGYSWDPNEVIRKWGRDEIVGDYVRLFRTLRPEVIVTMNIQGTGGDRAHEATTVLVREAYRAAGDAARYPEQLREGLRPWQASKLYFAGGGPGGGRGGRGGATGAVPAGPAPHVDRIDTSTYDPLLARTYAEIGTDARSNHKCQGTGTGLPPIAGIGGGRGGPGGGPAAPGGAAYTLVDTTIAGAMERPEGSLFDGVDLTIAGLAKYAGATPPAALTSALAAIADTGRQAKDLFGAGNDAGTAAPLEAGLTAVRALRASLAAMGVSDSARYEIDFRLKLEEDDYQNAVIAAHGLTFVAVANDGLVVAGQPVQLTLAASNRGGTDVAVSGVTISGFDNPAACTPGPVARNATFSCTSAATIASTAKLTEPYFTETYWKHPEQNARNTFDPSVPFGVPFAPTPFRAAFRLRAGSVEITKDLPVVYRLVKDLYFGDKQMELSVVPAFSVRMTPDLAVFPAQTGAAARPVSREVFVSVTNGTKGAAKATVALQVPAGWRVTPANAAIAFQNEDEALSARFQVTAPATATIGAFPLKAVVTSDVTGAQAYSNGYQEIEYPHVERRQVIKAAETTAKVVDVKTVPVKVGYIMGVGDQVPAALEELGAKVTLIDANALAWGDLSSYDVIMTGVRAYERRADLRAYNRRLLDYVQAGGTMIVNYNKTEFNGAAGRGRGGPAAPAPGAAAAGGAGARGANTAPAPAERGTGGPVSGGYGPYPALVDGSRVNDETIPVNVLVPTHPVFTFPNKLGPSTWANWVQERGQYFLAQKGSQYVDLISMTDSFPDNPGVKLGSLVEAKYGKGRWLYVGLGLWRQLPAGTDGAYQLLANLVALPKATVARR